jgi:nucleoside-diphosphate-sugar epimerase
MIAAVTGATGFLGGRLVRQLLEAGAEVRCLVRPGSDRAALRQGLAPAAARRLTTFAGSLERPEAYAAALRGSDVLYHAAAALRGSVPALFLSNVVGTRGLIEQAGRAGVRRLVLVSSIAVHGVGALPRHSVVDESCPLDPEPHRRDAYTFSKVEQERAAWDAHRRGAVPLVVVRPGVIYGPGRDCLSARVGLRFGGLLVKMGDQRLPHTHVDNCAAAVRLAGTVPGVEGESFNVVDDDPPTGGELLRAYRRGGGDRLRVVRVPGWAVGPLSGLCQWYHRRSRGQLPDVLTPYKSAAQWKPLHYANAKAKAVLGWEPRVGFAEGLRETLGWLAEARRREQPAAV